MLASVKKRTRYVCCAFQDIDWWVPGPPPHLNVVVETRLHASVSLEDAKRVGVPEILELHQTSRLPRSHLGHELVNEGIVRRARE